MSKYKAVHTIVDGITFASATARVASNHFTHLHKADVMTMTTDNDALEEK